MLVNSLKGTEDSQVQTEDKGPKEGVSSTDTKAQ